MVDIDIVSTELAVLLKKPFDIPFKVMLNNSIIGYRATILKQEYDKNGRYPLGSEDSIALPIINVNASECCCSESIECTVRRTRDKVPSPIRGNYKPEPFLYVGNSNMSNAFTYAQPHEIEGILTYSKFITNDSYYSFYNDYIYTFNFQGNKLGIRDVFSNPLQLLTLKNCDGVSCLSTVFIEDDMRKVIKQMILQDFGMTKELIGEQQVKINENDSQ